MRGQMAPRAAQADAGVGGTTDGRSSPVSKQAYRATPSQKCAPHSTHSANTRLVRLRNSGGRHVIGDTFPQPATPGPNTKPPSCHVSWPHATTQPRQPTPRLFSHLGQFFRDGVVKSICDAGAMELDMAHAVLLQGHLQCPERRSRCHGAAAALLRAFVCRCTQIPIRSATQFASIGHEKLYAVACALPVRGIGR